ncbi:hypothetical protein SELMODRAFT_90622, partial [Selaginella moellendorffii]
HHGQGPLLLTWSFNYGACGHALGFDEIKKSRNGRTALWFWMTPRCDPRKQSRY